MTKIAIASPIRPSAGSGNDVTANRWATHLRAIGHEATVVAVDEDDEGFPQQSLDALASADVLIALHARRAEPAARWWQLNRPGQPMVVGLAGTDLYRDMPTDETAMATVGRAEALIVLQAEAAERLGGFDPAWRDKTHVIYQSTARSVPPRRPAVEEFRVVVLAHLRQVKDPLLAAKASRLLPEDSRVVIHHGGRAHDPEWEQLATDEEAKNPRYVWHRELDGDAALELLATADVLACTSLSEGGANVVTEALAIGVPVIGTHIGGNVGLLGDDHPGLFPVGDAAAMAALLHKLETEPSVMAELAARTTERSRLAAPENERVALAALIDQMTGLI